MKKLFLHPLFSLGLAVRLALMFTAAPLAVSGWYVPFLDVSTARLSLDPWATWLEGGNTPAAFPYGYAMWLIFLPLTLAAKVAGVSLIYGYMFTLLVADTALLAALKKLLSIHDRLLLTAYWLSPIVILASYGLGLNDLIPVLLLTLALYFTRKLQLEFAGLACVSAISAKLSMVLALPFFLIYLFNNRALRRLLPRFVVGVLLGGVVLGLPFLFSSSGVHMLFDNPEMGKVYRLALDLGSNVVVYVVPLIYLVLLYLVWRVRRLNYDLFNATLGMAFVLIVLMTPASPGWFIWTIPFLVSYQGMSGKVAIALAGVFSGLYVLSTLLTAPLAFISGRSLDVAAALQLSGELGTHVASLVHTTMVATGIVFALRIWRETVSRNDYFRLSRKPFVIGIAGDSGAGKDTLSGAVEDLFGQHSVTKLSGDDYHLWDRQQPMWQVMTHLNPMANDLEGFSNDLVALMDGRSIQSRRYDHQIGKITETVRLKSNDFIIATGLHALYLPILRSCYGLSIYLDTEEGLRRYFKLQRDINQRGHTVERVMASIAKREPDSKQFIHPQSAYADLVLSLQPIHPRMLEDLDGKHPLRLKLVVRTRHGLNELAIIRTLVGVCGLHVDMATNTDVSEVALTIEGDTSAEDMALAARILCPQVVEFLDIQPRWRDGVVGLMQLLTLCHIDQALTKRII